MFEIEIHHKGDKYPTTYTVYKQEEADEAGIDYVYWREADTGDYALSDDGYVAKVIKRKKYDARRKNGKNIYFRFPWGYHFYNPKYDGANKRKLKMEGRKSKHTLTGKRPIEVVCGRDEMKQLAQAKALTRHDDLAIEMIKGELPPDEHKKYRRYMRSERFKTMVKQELKALLSEYGYDEEKIVELLEEGLNMARKKGDITNFRQIVENFQEMIGMNETETIKTTDRIEAQKKSKLLDEINEEKVSVERKTEERKRVEE